MGAGDEGRVREAGRGDPGRADGDAAAVPGWRWDAAAFCLLFLAMLWNGWSWLADDRMPPGDFAGFASQVQAVRDALLEHGRVPAWCVGCHAGASSFTSNLKEILLFPLAWTFDPVLATKLGFLIAKLASGLGLYVLLSRVFAAPGAGIVAGYALGFGAVANHQLQHLDAVFAIALLPPTILAALALLRRGGAGRALWLGALAAVLLTTNLHALAVPMLVAALALAAPWPGAGGPAGLLRDPAEAARRVGWVAVALAFTALLAASNLAWIAADSAHHSLFPESEAAEMRRFYVERSPFLFVNREDVLAPWLATHQPPGFDLSRMDGGRRYLGIVLLVVCGVGLRIGARAGDPVWRRFAAAAGALFGLHYWLALGPRTLVWEVATSFGAGETVVTALRGALLVASAAAAFVAVDLHARAKRAGVSPRAAVRAGIASVLLFAPAVSLWSALAAVLPMFRVQRSPGHFFDVAPVWLCALFGLALVAITRRIARPRAAGAFLLGVGLAVVVDYAPSRRQFEAGGPMAPLRRAGAMIAAVPGEGGSLRIGLPIVYRPLRSYLLGQAEAGYAWSWVPWQAGRYWVDYYASALYRSHGNLPGDPNAFDPDPALMGAARISHLLVPARLRPPTGWERVDQSGFFALWKGPAVAPLARGFRERLWLEGASRGETAALASRALRANLLLVSAPEGEAAAGVAPLRAGARAVLAPDPPDAVFAPAPAPIPASARRAAPGRIAIEVDAGDAPATLAIAEGHHPWWRAEVDGRDAPVLRASLALMAVAVGPGAHEVTLRFEPPGWVRAAEWIGMGGWLGVALGVSGLGWRALRIRLRARTGR